MPRSLMATQVNYNLALVATVEGDRPELRILPLVQLTTLIFWIYSMWLLVVTLDARIELALVGLVQVWQPWVDVASIIAKAVWWGIT